MKIDNSLGRQFASMRQALLNAFTSALDNGQFILGPSVTAFERVLAEYVGIPHVVATGNGYDAIRACLVSVGIQAGDKVAVSSHTCFATWAAIGAIGAKVVPVEPRLATLNMNPDALQAALEKERIRAVVLAHMHGLAAEMTAISALADSFQIPLIEDNAQAFGAQWNGQYTGTFGTIAALSFYPTKNLGALGDAGAVLTAHPALAQQVRAWRNYGSLDNVNHQMFGANSRMDEIQAAFLMVMLPKVATWNAERQSIAQQYFNELRTIPELSFQAISAGATHVYHHYIIRTDARDALRAYLLENGIPTGVHYLLSPMEQPAASEMLAGKYENPIAAQISQSTLSLPCFPGLTSTEINYICDKIHSFYNK